MKTKRLRHTAEELDDAIDKIQSFDVRTEGNTLYMTLDTQNEETTPTE